jgi:hypothetical protein
MPLRPVNATITREESTRDGSPVTSFTLRYDVPTPGPGGEIREVPFWRRFDVEKAMPHRILGWETSDGERVAILGSTRLPYWELNGPGEESYLAELGLDPASTH